MDYRSMRSTIIVGYFYGTFCATIIESEYSLD
jgi:hypothetical protein